METFIYRLNVRPVSLKVGAQSGSSDIYPLLLSRF